MFNFDVVMPLALFLVTIAAMLLNGRAEKKLKGVLEEKELRTRDTVLLVASVGVAVSLIVFIPQLAIMIIFLFSYSMLLFIFGYLFSDMQKKRTELFLAAFVIGGLAAGASRFFVFGQLDNAVYGTLAFLALSIFALAALVYETKRTRIAERWYVAVFPPTLFICLYLFFSQTPIWSPYLLDSYGFIFAILIILYLSSMFTWKSTLVFATLLTVVDIVLVLVTGTMVSAAKSVQVLGLPVLVSLPTLPTMLREGSRLYMSLGLGDFFFAGLLTIQTYKKYGKRFAVWSAIAMVISFFVFEALLLTSGPTAFPGTLMIICGWLLPVIPRSLKEMRAR
jgi:hypothetical protein